MGTPGKNSKVLVARKKSLSTLMIEGSGLKPGIMGLTRPLASSPGKISINMQNWFRVDHL